MRTPAQSSAGSVTLLALCFTAVLGIALGSYLALYQRAYDFGTREFQTDRARQLAQTGLEEALWALNQNSWTGSGPDSNTAWATAGATRSVTLDYGALGQGATGTVVLTIANYAGTGPVWPAITSAATVTLADGRSFRRTLQASTAFLPLFTNAIASASSYVRFYDGGTVDSWNSDPDSNSATPAVAYTFTAGNAINYAAVIAATDDNDDYDTTHAVGINQAQINGYVATSGKPLSYASSGAPPGRVQGPVAAGVNIDPARVGRSAFIPTDEVFTITPPPLVTGSYTLLTFLSALLTINPADNEIYSAPSGFTMPAGLLGYTLSIDRPVKMVVNGNFSVGNGLLGPARVVINPPDGALQVFVTGNVTIAGNGIANLTGDPSRLAIFSTSNATTPIRYDTPAGFCGVIYSETKPIDIEQTAIFAGALLSRNHVRFTSGAANPVFHYDTALRQTRFSNVTTPYIITYLTES